MITMIKKKGKDSRTTSKQLITNNSNSPDTNPEISSTREVLPVLVERHGHDSVGGVECFLDSITVVNVNVNVQHPLVVS